MKIRFTSLLLQLKLTIAFAVFGLIVGISSYFVSTVITTKTAVETFIESELNPVGQLNKKYPNDWVYNIFKNEEKTHTPLAVMKNIIPPDLKNSIFISFYYKNRNDHNWYLLKDTSNPSKWMVPISKNESKELESALKHNVINSGHSFLNFSQKHTLLLNITKNGDSADYVVKTTVNRENLLDYIIKRKRELELYLIVTLIGSLILGYIFSITITKPVRALTKKAVSFSDGNMTVRFKTKRKDDIGELANSLDRLSVSIYHRITTIKTMNKIDRAVNSSLSRNELLSKVVGYIHDQFEGSIIIVYESTGKHYTIAAASDETLFNVGDLIEKNRTTSFFTDNISKIVDLNPEILYQVNRSFPLDYSHGKALTVPLVQKENIVGYIVFFSKYMTNRDKDTIILLGEQASVALLSMKDFEEKRIMHEGMLHALSKSIDAKSRWTAGHSKRVAFHALQIANKIGFGSDTLKTIEIGALLHDIGKLGISEKILDKPDKLTEEEYSIIKSHPLLGENIIADIPHFDQIKYAVRHHHEYWNGKGYPDGLSGDSIPMISRIISVADVWDALTADRPYRSGYSINKAKEIMIRERGKLFDPALIDLFLETL